MLLLPPKEVKETFIFKICFSMKSFPHLQAVLQELPGGPPCLSNPELILKEKLAVSGLLAKIRPGQRVALAVGSRGINRLVPLVKTLIDAVGERKGCPFILPAMGSHGGGTAAGQEALLESMGISEKLLGVPVVSAMEVRDLGLGTADGARLITSVAALEADWVVLLARIKAHTIFQGEIESGLLKMLVVGLGKEEGARQFHLYGLRSSFPAFLLELARDLAANLRILAGVALLENAGGLTVALEAVPPEDFEKTDQELLSRYKDFAPRLPFLKADLLIVERMGKDISGTGMDTTVIGRSRHPVRPEPPRPKIARIWARSLTKASQGNANGIGLADFVSSRLVRTADMEKTIVNSLASLAPERAFLPPSLEPERRILVEALRTAGVIDQSETKIAWIMDTGSLDCFLATDSLARSLDANARRHPAGKNIPFLFDDNGDLLSFEEHWRESAVEAFPLESL